jgi:hypothetical protein
MPGARLTKRNLRNEGKIWYNPADQTRSCKTTPFCRYADKRAINISDSFYGQNFMVNILIHSLYGIRHVNSTPNLLTAITLHDDQKSGQNLSALSSFNGIGQIAGPIYGTWIDSGFPRSSLSRSGFFSYDPGFFRL